MGIDVELTKWLTGLGVGGVLAAFMFTFYRRDVKGYLDQWRGQSELLLQVVRENTKAVTELRMEIKNRRPDGSHRWDHRDDADRDR